MKICKVCNKEKEFEQFVKRQNGEYRNECRDCKLNYYKQYRKDKNNNSFVINKEPITTKICKKCGAEKLIENFVKQKRICKDCKKEYLKNWNNINSDHVRELRKKKYKDNCELKKEYSRNYFRKNKEKINKRSLIYRKEILSKDSIFILKTRIGTSIRRVLRLNNIQKTFLTKDILGCSLEHLRYHIESLFQNGMSWENMNEWQIDHIVPTSIAKTKEEIILLNHYTNLRPLWNLENILKSNSIDKSNELYINLIKSRKNIS